MSITVVIPLYNKAQYIQRAIDSVLYQSFQDFHILVVDDGSTDEGPALVSSYTDSRIAIVSQSNQGVSAARNKGIKEASDDLIAFLDADDVWEPTMLETMNRLATTYPQCDVIATSYKSVDAQGAETEAILRGISFQSSEGLLTNYFQVASQSNPPICSSSVMIRKRAIQAIGGFPVGIKQGEDLLTWARLAARYQIAYSTQPLALFYTQRNSYGKPVRVPTQEDPVGEELSALYHRNPQLPGLKAYVGHWHKMRASIFMRLPHHSTDARKEITESLRWNPKVKNLYLYRLLLLLPYTLRMKLLATRE